MSVSVLACDDDTDTDGTASTGDTSKPEPAEASCTIASTVELADANVVAPNGRSGAEILAAIPESFQTTLNWDLSNSNVEVTVSGAAGQSSTLDLVFTLPAAPKFYFVERVVSPGADPGVEVICDDYVKTTLDLSAQTQDGALSVTLSAVEVNLGPDDPSTGYWARPFILTTQPTMSPTVDFISPVTQPADSEKSVALSFDSPEITGAITVFATTSSETHRIVIARW